MTAQVAEGRAGCAERLLCRSKLTRTPYTRFFLIRPYFGHPLFLLGLSGASSRTDQKSKMESVCAWVIEQKFLPHRMVFIVRRSHHDQRDDLLCIAHHGGGTPAPGDAAVAPVYGRLIRPWRSSLSGQSWPRRFAVQSSDTQLEAQMLVDLWPHSKMSCGG